MAGATLGPPMAKPSVGLIGAGNVGKRFVEFLIEDGFSVTVHDVDPAAQNAAVERGADGAPTPAAVASDAAVVVLSLPGRPYVEAVMEGEDGILAGITAGSVVMDTGTTPPSTDVQYAAVCAEHDAGYLDSPLTWYGPGPRATMFVGGDLDQYKVAKPVIECLSTDHHHFGPVGSGHVVKAGHRAYQNLRAAVDAEIVSYFDNNGIAPAAVNELLDLGVREELLIDEYPTTAGFASAVAGDPWDHPGGEARIDERGARPRLRESEWAKDPTYALRIAHASNTHVPLLEAATRTQRAAENIASALARREIGYLDEEWVDRTGFRLVYRLLSQPGHEWASYAAQAEE